MAYTPNQAQPKIGSQSVGAAETGNSDRLIPEVWAKEIESNRENNLVMWNLIDSKFESEIRSQGDVIHIPFLGKIDTDTKVNHVAGAETPVDSLDVTTVDLLIDRYIRQGLGIQDALKAQSKYSLREAHVKALSRWLDEAKDVEVMTKAVAGFNVIPKRAATGANGTLAFADIVDAASDLDEKNVPEDGRVIVVNSKGRADLRKIPEFTSYKETGEAGLVKSMNGLVGELYGMPVYVTNAIQKSSDGLNYNFMMFHKSAIVGATQDVPRVEFDRNVNKGVDEVYASELFGVKVLRPDHGVIITRKA